MDMTDCMSCMHLCSRKKFACITNSEIVFLISGCCLPVFLAFAG
jgi:hypothetical protein